MSDESGAGTAVEEKDEESSEIPGLSNKALKKLARYAAQYATEATEERESKQVDPAQRPDFQPSAPEAQDFAPVAMPEHLKGLAPSSLVGAPPEVKEVYSQAVSRDLESGPKDFAHTRFPRDFDAKDFCMSRYCLAVDRAQNSLEGSTAFQKYAPRESAYYQALAHYGKESKALGEYTSGQDGGFLAPEIWTNQFFDISGVAA